MVLNHVAPAGGLPTIAVSVPGSVGEKRYIGVNRDQASSSSGALVPNPRVDRVWYALDAWSAELSRVTHSPVTIPDDKSPVTHSPVAAAVAGRAYGGDRSAAATGRLELEHVRWCPQSQKDDLFTDRVLDGRKKRRRGQGYCGRRSSW